MEGDSFDVVSGSFQTLDPPVGAGWVTRLRVVTRNLDVRSTPLVARVGDQAVEALMILPGGVGLQGYLATRPQPGDRLFLGYDTADVETDVVYSGNEPQRVA